MNITEIFKHEKARNITLKALRPMILTIDGKSTHVNRDDVVEVAHADLSNLVQGSDYTVVSTGKKSPPLPNPTPEAPQIKPAPDFYRDLPELWTAHHAITAKRASLIEHARLISKELSAVIGTREIHGATGKVLAGEIKLTAGGFVGSQNVVSTLREIDFDSPRIRRAANQLIDSLERAEAEVKELNRANERDQVLRHWEAGQLVIEAHSEAEAMASELREAGLAIFSARVKPLGLAPYNVRKLYRDSLDYQKCELAPAKLHDVKNGGTAPDGSQRRYVEASMPDLGRRLLNYRAFVKRLKPILKAAKAELAA